MKPASAVRCGTSPVVATAPVFDTVAVRTLRLVAAIWEMVPLLQRRVTLSWVPGVLEVRHAVWVEQPLSSQVGVDANVSVKAAGLGATIVGLVACSQQTPGPYTKFEGMPPDATVTMDEVQAAYIGNAGGGSGTLTYRGASYPFTVAGIGVGGIGASTLDAAGDVYNLPSAIYSPVLHAQGQYRLRGRHNESR